jgi:predicted phosphodiesterase
VRLALLSDVHGNPIALGAVLADVAAHGGVDGYWVLGDHAAQGYDPAGALRRLVALPNAAFSRGNTDRYVLGDEYPGATVARAQADPGLVPLLRVFAQGLGWTHGRLSQDDPAWIDWLAALPLELRTTLPDGTRLLGVHASPGQDDGHGVQRDASDAALAALLEGCGADLVVVGHTHRALDRTVGGVRVVNLGCVSNPLDPDRMASYALLEANAGGHELTTHRIAYDRAAVVEAIGRSRFFPNPEWLIAKFASAADGFRCSLPEGAVLGGGTGPDGDQVALEWLGLDELGAHRLYPERLRALLRRADPLPDPYLGDVR